jgi:hypothetical protein
MTLLKKGQRTIEVDGEKFVWKIRRKISHEECHDAELNIPIQHISGGRVFIAHISYSRSGYARQGLRETNDFKQVTPAIIASNIKAAIALGWQYKIMGKPISIIGGGFTENTWGARH